MIASNAASTPRGQQQVGVLSLDPTFDLGKFYVTPMVLPLQMFCSKRTGKSLYYIGPFLIHQTLKEPAYHYFCSQLVGMRSSLRNVLSVGTRCCHTGNMEEGRGAVQSARPGYLYPRSSCFTASHGGE